MRWKTSALLCIDSSESKPVPSQKFTSSRLETGPGRSGFPARLEKRRRRFPIKVRAHMVEDQTREYVLGAPHEVTDRLFVVRRFSCEGPPARRSGSALAMAKRGVAPCAPPDRAPVSGPSPRPRSLVLGRRLVSRLRGLFVARPTTKKTYAIVTQISPRKPVLRKLPSNDGRGRGRARFVLSSATLATQSHSGQLRTV